MEKQRIAVAVIYLNHQETHAQSPANILAGLWRQLVLGRPLPAAAYDLYAEHSEQGTRPSIEEVDYILSLMIAQLSHVFIIVDALDEYPEQDRSILLSYLMSLGSTVSLMLTSRPHLNIDLVVEDLEILEIRAKGEDILRYVDAKILKTSRLSRHIKNSPGLREEIEEIILRRSDRMLVLICPNLNRTHSIA